MAGGGENDHWSCGDSSPGGRQGASNNKWGLRRAWLGETKEGAGELVLGCGGPWYFTWQLGFFNMPAIRGNLEPGRLGRQIRLPVPVSGEGNWLTAELCPRPGRCGCENPGHCHGQVHLLPTFDPKFPIRKKGKQKTVKKRPNAFSLNLI